MPQRSSWSSAVGHASAGRHVHQPGLPTCARSGNRTRPALPGTGEAHLEQRVTILCHHRGAARALALQLAEPQLRAHLGRGQGEGRRRRLRWYLTRGSTAGAAASALLSSCPSFSSVVAKHTGHPLRPTLVGTSWNTCLPTCRSTVSAPAPPSAAASPATLPTTSNTWVASQPANWASPAMPRGCLRQGPDRTGGLPQARLPLPPAADQAAQAARSGRGSWKRGPGRAAWGPAELPSGGGMLAAAPPAASQSPRCLPPPQPPGEAQSRALSLSPRHTRPANHRQPCVRSSPFILVGRGGLQGPGPRVIGAAWRPPRSN